MEDYQWGEGWVKMGEKLQGLRSITVRYQIERGMLRIGKKKEKPKNLYALLMDMK